MSRCILALELSTSCGSIAVVQGEAVLFETTFQAQRSHNAQVFAPLKSALLAAGQALDGVVVGVGPGSYTGVRIAIAAAQGIGLSRQVPVVGCNSLVAATDQADFGVVGDARRSRWYVAIVRQHQLNESIAIVNPEDLTTTMAAANVRHWMTCDSTAPSFLPDLPLAQPSATRLATIASRWSESTWISQQQTQALEPRYLEGAFITQAKKR
jgi:tRNA threonylcarbamoyladenosine biosynthesis protein TsaB